MLWGATVTRDEPLAIELPMDLRITHACLSSANIQKDKRYALQATYEDLFSEDGGSTTATVCSLSHKNDNVSLDIVVDSAEHVVFATGGNVPIHLSGYMIIPEFYDSDSESDSDDDDMSSDSEDDDEAGVKYVLEALQRAGSSDSEDDDFDSEDASSDDDDEVEPKVRDITNEEESDDDSEDDSEDDDVEMDEESSGDSVEFEDQEEVISQSILKKIQEKAKKIEEEQRKASSPAVGKKRRASASPAGAEPSQQKKQKTTPKQQKAAASPAAAAVPVKSATHRNQDQKKNKSPLRRTLPGGLVVETVKQGTGKVAQKGKSVTVKYVGKLASGKKFDAGTFQFRVGTRQVIQGWDIGIPGMKVGEQRKLIIPPKLAKLTTSAYGKKGAGKDIPPNSTLHFDVELLRC